MLLCVIPQAETIFALYAVIASGHVTVPTELPDSLRALLQHMLTADPASRPTVHAVHQHT